MIRIWGKIIKNNKLIQSKVVEAKIKETYQQALSNSITDLCKIFDIEKPYWLPSNMDEFNKRGKTSFNMDNFIEEIEFDKFEIEELDVE